MNEPGKLTDSVGVLPLDDADRRILSILGKNARLSSRAIAREMKVSAGLVIERVRRLEQSGVIRGYRVEVYQELVGSGVVAFASVQINPSVNPDAVLQAAMAIAEVEVAHWTTAPAQLLLTIRAADHEQLHRLMLGPLRELPGNITVTLGVGMLHKRRVGGQFAYTWQDEEKINDE